jgi:hypothetical protein
MNKSDARREGELFWTAHTELEFEEDSWISCLLLRSLPYNNSEGVEIEGISLSGGLTGNGLRIGQNYWEVPKYEISLEISSLNPDSGRLEVIQSRSTQSG